MLWLRENVCKSWNKRSILCGIKRKIKRYLRRHCIYEFYLLKEKFNGHTAYVDSWHFKNPYSNCLDEPELPCIGEPFLYYIEDGKIKICTPYEFSEFSKTHSLDISEEGTITADYSKNKAYIG